ncbi:MAG: RNA polymerase factor sigma-32 [Oligoflexales bacterium]|nr:RNA polymerase factor sigma-32 [Oligoflexales bacterium]
MKSKTNTKLPSLYRQQSVEALSPLQQYLREVSKYPLLNPEEEFELAQKQFEEGDVQAAHRLVTSNLRLVVKIASDFRQSQVNLLDLIQEGNYGLMQAVKKFNPYKGVKLSSYAAWWIRAYILKYIMDNKSQVKIGTTAAQRKLFFNLHKEAQKLLRDGEVVDPKVIAASLNVKEEEVIEMQKRLGSPDASLDVPMGDEPGQALRKDMLADKTEAIDVTLANEEQREIFSGQLEEFHQTLKGRDREVFELRMLSETPLSLQELGDKYGVSRERARQIEAKILKNLKKFVEQKGIL